MFVDIFVIIIEQLVTVPQYTYIVCMDVHRNVGWQLKKMLKVFNYPSSTQLEILMRTELKISNRIATCYVINMQVCALLNLTIYLKKFLIYSVR